MTETPAPRRVLLVTSTQTYKVGAFLEAARQLGVELIVAAERAPALAWASPHSQLVLPWWDAEAVAQRVLEFARVRPIQAVVATDDESAAAAARAAAVLGLPHHGEAAVGAARDKLRLRETLGAARRPVPWFSAFPVDRDPRAVAREVPFPCVLKPRFLSASRGVIRADDPETFLAAWSRLRRLLERPQVAAAGGDLAHSILVESYLPGGEFALEGLVTRGRLRALALFDKPEPLVGPYFEETLYVTPSRAPRKLRAALWREAQRCVEALGLSHGPIHAELRATPRGVVLLEIAPRSIGGLCSRTLRFERGSVSLEALLLRHALGEDVSRVRRERRAAGVLMVPIPRAGVLREIRGAQEAREVPGIEEVRFTLPLGQHVEPPPEGARYLGFVFARAARPETVEAALRRAWERLEIVVEPARAGSAGQSGLS